MPTLKNPFPTSASHAEEVATVRGMEVHRTSGPGWSQYLVQNPHDPEEFVSARIKYLPREDRIDRVHAFDPRLTWEGIVQGATGAGGTELVPARFWEHNRRAAEHLAVHELVDAAERVVRQRIAYEQGPEQLLGLVAPRAVRHARRFRRMLDTR